MTRLTWQTVNAIRDAYIPGLVPCSVLASTYHVGRSTIFDVVSGRTWKAPAAQTPPEATGRLQSHATEHSQAVNHLHATTALVESPDGAAPEPGHVPNRCYTKPVNTIQNPQKGDTLP